MKGYASVADLADFMGISFSSTQQVIAGLALGAAEQWLDATIKHAWMEAGPITEDIVVSHTNIIRLSKPPIDSLTSLGIAWGPNAPSTLLDSTYAQFYVRSLRDGVIWLAPAFTHVFSAQAIYVPNADPVPDEVSLATLTLAAGNLRVMSIFNDDVDPTLVQRYSVGGELEVEFRKTMLTSGMAAQQALSMLEAWTKGYAVV